MPSDKISAAPADIAQRLLHSGVRYVRARLEILELDISVERDRIGTMMAFSLMLSLSALMTAQLTAILILAIYWDTPWRLHAIVAMTVATAAATAVIWWTIRRLKRQSARPISSALRDLEKLGGGQGDRE